MAVAGGGLRAAYWTAITLAAVDARSCGAFSRHVYAISGVSGGSLGAAAFVALLAEEAADPQRGYRARPCTVALREEVLKDRAARLRRFLGSDFLSPVVAAALFGDSLQAFVPFAFLEGHDRAAALERFREARWRELLGSDRFARPLPELYEANGDGLLPRVFFNVTSVEDGARGVLSSVALVPRYGFDAFDGMGAAARAARTAPRRSARSGRDSGCSGSTEGSPAAVR